MENSIEVVEVVNHLNDLCVPKDTLLVALRFSTHPKFGFLLDLLKFVLTNNVLKFDDRFFAGREMLHNFMRASNVPENFQYIHRSVL